MRVASDHSRYCPWPCVSRVHVNGGDLCIRSAMVSNSITIGKNAECRRRRQIVMNALGNATHNRAPFPRQKWNAFIVDVVRNLHGEQNGNIIYMCICGVSKMQCNRRLCRRIFALNTTLPHYTSIITSSILLNLREQTYNNKNIHDRDSLYGCTATGK